MSIFSSQRLDHLYQMYGATEVTFNAQVILVSGLITGNIRLTVGDFHLSSVLYACSMKGARIIAEVGDDFSKALAYNGRKATLQLSFRPQGKLSDLTFFVLSQVESMAEYYSKERQVQFMTLSFVQKPPDVLTGILGSLLEINTNAIRRKDERIVLTAERMKIIGMESKESCVVFLGTARRCIVRDLSFSGAKILVMTPENPQKNTRVALKLARCEVKDDNVLDGSIVRVEDVEGRDDVVAMSIRYSSEPPIKYKQQINALLPVS
jgi:hypothetical protein